VRSLAARVEALEAKPEPRRKPRAAAKPAAAKPRKPRAAAPPDAAS
jgi:outer membrane murein-binding lipoprotein Lpp